MSHVRPYNQNFCYSDLRCGVFFYTVVLSYPHQTMPKLKKTHMLNLLVLHRNISETWVVIDIGQLLLFLDLD